MLGFQLFLLSHDRPVMEAWAGEEGVQVLVLSATERTPLGCHLQISQALPPNFSPPPVLSTFPGSPGSFLYYPSALLTYPLLRVPSLTTQSEMELSASLCFLLFLPSF